MKNNISMLKYVYKMPVFREVTWLRVSSFNLEKLSLRLDDTKRKKKSIRSMENKYLFFFIITYHIHNI